MDASSVYGPTFDQCLTNLEKVLKWCKETNLVLNWKKCKFIVSSDIVIGHRISKRGIEVDPVKNEVIIKLLPPSTVKAVQSFLEHAGFYK